MNWARGSWACVGPGGPVWTRLDQSGPGAPGPLSHREGFGFQTQLISHKQTKFLSTHFLSSLSSAPATATTARAAAATGVAVTAPPPPSHNHRAGKPDLQEVGSGFYAFGVSLCVSGLDYQCGLILGVFVYDYWF